MIRIRRGTVVAVRERHPGLLDVEVEVGGAVERALAYPALCGPVSEGSRVVLNTTAVALGLGTGGYHFVIAIEDGPDVDVPESMRAMKLRYTPVQAAVSAVEESGAPLADTLDGAPVVAAGLHSTLAPVLLALQATRPGLRAALVHTDGAALPLAFSSTIPALRDAGLLHLTVTAGQAFGGDIEAVGLHSAMLAARAAGADAIVVAMGPGNLGTGSTFGFATIEVAEALHAAVAVGGRPIAVARISFADARPRHRGISHHTLTTLGRATFVRAAVPLPPLPPERAAEIAEAVGALRERHDVVEVPLGAAEEALAGSPVPLESMGRGFRDDPHAFRAAAAAGVLAARG